MATGFDAEVMAQLAAAYKKNIAELYQQTFFSTMRDIEARQQEKAAAISWVAHVLAKVADKRAVHERHLVRRAAR